MIGGRRRPVNEGRLWSDRHRLDAKDIWRVAGLFAIVTTIIESIEREGSIMFEELTEELLDLSATVRGHGAAVYAVVDDNTCGGCGLCCSVVLCCCCCDLCW
jgi:hypothetical protein